jgi:radical SAM superfamily enzyme YgiQ (UPF0313 family)
MTKVLLVSANIESLPDPVFPIGPAYIAALLGKHRIPHEVLDLCFVDDYQQAITSALDAYSPDIIGLSIRNVDNVSYPEYRSYLPFYRKVVATIRDNSRGLIVLGGSGFTLMPEQFMDALGADVGIAGEGEEAFLHLIHRLEEGRPPAPATIIYPSATIGMDINTLPFPDRSGFDNDAYLNLGGMGNIQTKRGCPFKCIYCTYPVIEGNRIRSRDPSRVCDEMEDLIKSGIKNVFIVDNEFNYPVAHTAAVCREMVRRKLSIEWGCYANPAFITDELVTLMQSAGCTGLEFGTDAAEPGMLSRLGKNFTIEDIRNASAICRKNDMPFCHSLLLGGPGETMDTIQATVDNILEIDPTAVICMIGIRIFPHTRIAAIAMEEEITDASENYLKPAFYLSPAVADEILPFVENFSKKHPTWIFPGFNINMYTKLQQKLRRFGLKGPLWEYMKLGKRFKRQR